MARILTLAAGLALAVTSPALAEREPSQSGMVEDACPVDSSGLWARDPYVLKYDWAWLCRFREENRAWNADHPARVVFLGDSITEGWIRNDPSFFGEGVLDRGLSGQTSPQLLVRFMQDVVALHPQVVHIMGGTNDVAGNTGPTTAEAYKSNIRAMVTLARANGIRVVLGSILPADHFNWEPGLKPAAQIVALNAWLREYATAEGIAFADYHAAMAGPNGELRPELGSDGVHPNAQGYALMRPIALDALARAERAPQ